MMLQPAELLRFFITVPARLGIVVVIAVAWGSSNRAAGSEMSMLPTVTTRSAAAVGNTGMTVNASIHPHGLYTRYFFEYGSDSTYGKQTLPTELPPRLSAYYRVDWNDGDAGWYERHGPIPYHAEGGVSGGFVRYLSPTLDDHNHDDGIGTLNLSAYMYTGSLREPKDMSVFLSGGDPDLRGAKVSLAVRGRNWVPNGSELIWWTQSQSNLERGTQPGWQRANWAYTGFMATDALHSGQWENVHFRLRHDSEQWSFGGFWTKQSNYERYSYWPIDQAQAHVNYNFIFVLAFVDPQDPPLGELDFDDFELVYRNRSLVFPTNGGRLIESPESDADPASLTDGWRFGPDRMWHSAEHPQSPLEFVYAFVNPVTIQAVQLHQNPDWPAKQVECLVSQDGKTFSALSQHTLPQEGIPGANYAFALQTGLSAKATQLKVRILSGYPDDRWGLGEIEVFGTGATMLPDDEWYDVNTDIVGLEPGTTYHYRLVATNANGISHGQDRTFFAATDSKPQVRTGGCTRLTDTSAKIEGRVTPMGRRTTFHFEYGYDASYGQTTEPTYAGLQLVPRTVFANVTGLRAAMTYHYRVVAVNEKGESRGPDAIFRTIPKK